MSGPPKTPTHLRLVRGNPSKRPINKNEPQPPKGVPPVPKHFDKQGKYWFKRMMLSIMRRLKLIFWNGLAAKT